MVDQSIEHHLAALNRTINQFGFLILASRKARRAISTIPTKWP
jgi:hypothetical protein